jgi:HAD superfamily hydrolase (TIGR01549 family)
MLLNNMKALILFDCDGTLLNTYELIEETFKQTFKQCLPNLKFTEEDIRSYFGPTIDDTFWKLTSSKEKHHELMTTYRKINLALHPEYVYAYPNVEKTLKTLKEKGYITGIVSNKMKSVIQYGLEITNINSYIDEIIGSDMVEIPKPNPMGIRKIMNHFASTKAIMVGDSLIDIQAAQNAGVTSIGVTWAYVSKDEFYKAKADYVIDDMSELITILGE